jgi:hypothetical protein
MGAFFYFKEEKNDMRKLNTYDLFKTATILGKIGTKVRISEDMNPKQLGVTFFASALQYAETDFKNLLANICEMTVEEFDKQPFDYPMEVIEKLIETEDMKSFLERVKSLVGKMQNQPSSTEFAKGITGE